MKTRTVSEFKETKIGDVCPFAYGKGLPERERNTGKIPVYGSNGLVGWHDTSFVNGPCIIIGRKGSIGKIHYSENSCWPIDTTFYILENENFHLKFIFYLLKFLNLENMDSDTSVPGLNRTAAHDLEIKIPEKKEQIRISTILENLDTRISNLQNQNKVLEQIVQAIYKSWFVDFDGVTEFEDSELGQIPKGWKVQKLSEITTVKGRIGWRGYTISDLTNSGPLVIGGKHISNKNRFDFKNPIYISKEKFEESPEIKVSQNDIIISKTGKVGPVAIVEHNIGDATINPNVSLIKEIKIFPYYLYQYLLTPHSQDFIKGAASGSSVQPTINNTTLKKLEVLIPNNKMLKKFEKIVMMPKMKIVSNELHIENLTRVRDSLLPKLMSGQIRV